MSSTIATLEGLGDVSCPHGREPEFCARCNPTPIAADYGPVISGLTERQQRARWGMTDAEIMSALGRQIRAERRPPREFRGLAGLADAGGRLPVVESVLPRPMSTAEKFSIGLGVAGLALGVASLIVRSRR